MKKLSKIYLALILIFLFAPIAVLIVFSFNEDVSTAVFSGFSLKWYRELFRNSEILNALKNSLILAISSSLIATVLGTAAAFGIHHMKNKTLRRSLMSVTNIPMLNPELITGISMMFLFVFVGGLLGLKTKLSFWTMLIAHITFNLPYVILNVLPKFKQMDKSLPEAALDLGCTPWQSFYKVQLPAILPGVLTGLIMAFTMSLDDFVISYFTSGVDFQTLPVLIYSMTKRKVKPTIYALSTLIFAVILVMLLLSNMERSSDERMQAKKAKEEKKRQEAILRAQKKRKASSKNSQNSLTATQKKPSYWGKIIAVVLSISVLISLCVSIHVFSKRTVTLNVYNWGEYISDGSEGTLDTNKAFEEYCLNELGMKVKVNYVTYASNEDLYAKLSAEAVGFDVIIPSDYMVARLATEGLLEELDFSNIPLYEEAIPEGFRNLYYDPENKYSVPYTYGMVGVIYNANVVDEEDIGSWDLLWNEKYAGSIMQFKNPRDAFGTAFYKLGLDVNSTDTADWDRGFEELKKQKKLSPKYVMDEIYNLMELGEKSVSAYYAGDFLTMVDNQAPNVDLQFYYPDPTNLFVDAMCIPKGSAQKELAEIYINFMLSEEVAIANAEYICYASPNALVYNSTQYQEDMGEYAYDILYPDGFDFASAYDSNCFRDLDQKTKDYYNKKWNELQVSN